MTITYNGERAEILAEAPGKRGRTLLTIKLASGRVIKIDARMVTPEIEFAAPISAAEFYAPLPSSAEAARTKINR